MVGLGAGLVDLVKDAGFELDNLSRQKAWIDRSLLPLKTCENSWPVPLT